MWTGADDEAPEYPTAQIRGAIPMPTLAAGDIRVPREPAMALLLAADRARRARCRAMQPTWDAICRSLAIEQRRQQRQGRAS